MSIFVNAYKAHTIKTPNARTASNLYFQVTDTPAVVTVAETNQHFLGKFTDVKISLAVFIQNLYTNPYPITAAAIAETNPHFVGRLTDVKINLAAFVKNLYTNPSPIAPPESGAPHFIARTQTQLIVSPRHLYYFTPQDVSGQTNVSQVENASAFIGIFQPQRHKVPIGLRTGLATDVPVSETNTHFIGKLVDVTINKAAFVRNLYTNPWPELTSPQDSTGSGFIGVFVPPMYTLLKSLRQNAGVDAVTVAASETNTHFIAKLTVTPHTLLPLYRQQITGDVARETNTHFVGKYAPTVHTVLSLYRQNEARDVAAVAETNVHTIGKLTAPVINPAAFVLNLFNVPNSDIASPFIGDFSGSFVASFEPYNHYLLKLLRQNVDIEPVAAVVETNVHFVGKYLPTAHTLLPSLRQNAGNDVARETNTHFIGKLQPSTHNVLQSLRQNAAVDIQAAAAETNQHFIGKFRPLAHNVLQSLRQNAGSDVARETNTHFIGKLQAQTHNLLPSLRQNAAVDIQPAAAETNTYFLGKFQPNTHTILQSLRQNAATDIEPAVLETNPHFIGYFTTQVISRFGYNQVPTDISVVAETNTHFVARLIAPTHTLLPLLRQHSERDTTPVQAETNTHFIARLTTPAHTLLPLLRQHSERDTTPPQAETNVNFIARHQVRAHFLNRNIWQNTDTQAPLALENNTHFLGRFTPTSIFTLRSLFQNPANDVQPETNTHFIAKYQPITHTILRRLLQSEWADQQQETNVNFIARHQPTTHTILRRLLQSEWGDFQSTNFETNQHFIGRFTDNVITRFRYNFEEIEASGPLGTQAETNVHFIGRFKPDNFFILQALRQTPNTDFIVGPPPAPPPSGIDPDAVPPYREPLTPELIKMLRRLQARKKVGRDLDAERRQAIRDAIEDAIVKHTALDAWGADGRPTPDDHARHDQETQVDKVLDVKKTVEAVGGKGVFDWRPVERAAIKAQKDLESGLTRVLEERRRREQDEEDIEILMMTM